MKKIFVLLILTQSLTTIAQKCALGTSKDSLDYNNVNAMLLNGGDMFWDIGDSFQARYKVPKNTGVSAIFAGGLWIGGKDDKGEIYVAAETYRQGFTQSYFPGPIVDDDNLTTDSSACSDWDRHFKVYASNIDHFKKSNSGNINTIDEQILFWPGKNNPFLQLPGNDKSYAPFVDVDGDGNYNPLYGDYPKITGHQSVWWIMNDVGGDKKLGNGLISEPMGLEISVEAFAIKSNDALNNTTFQTYKIHNKSSKTYSEAYCGLFLDFDLGSYDDDFTGCDVKRGMGIGYNGKPTDKKYGAKPPAIGVDFVKGIRADPNDGIDNNRNCVTDEPKEEIIMSNFLVYFSSSSTITGNPARTSDFYYYLRNKWRDASNVTFDGISGLSTETPETPKTTFMLPMDSDLEYGWGLGGNCSNPISDSINVVWDESTAGHDPSDRRFVMSMGAFTLHPGAVIEFTAAFIYAQGNDNLHSIKALQEADDVVQNAVDNNFINYPLIIEKQIQEVKLAKIYPTLLQDILMIQPTQNDNYTLHLYDNIGQLSVQQSFKNNTQINVSDLSKGLYYYQISNGTTVQKGKVIKL